MYQSFSSVSGQPKLLPQTFYLASAWLLYHRRRRIVSSSNASCIIQHSIRAFFLCCDHTISRFIQRCCKSYLFRHHLHPLLGGLLHKCALDRSYYIMDLVTLANQCDTMVYTIEQQEWRLQNMETNIFLRGNLLGVPFGETATTSDGPLTPSCANILTLPMNGFGTFSHN